MRTWPLSEGSSANDSLRPARRLDYFTVAGLTYLSAHPLFVLTSIPRLGLTIALVVICLIQVVHRGAHIGARPVLVSLLLSGLLILTPLLTGDPTTIPYLYYVSIVFLGLLFVHAVSLERFQAVFVRVMVVLSASSLALMVAVAISSTWVSFLPLQSGPFADYRHAGIALFNLSRDPGTEGTIVGRNFGIAWEPGAFAVLICLALAMLVFSQATNPGSPHRNLKISILVVAVLSTFSVTGYACLAVVALSYIAQNAFSRSWIVIISTVIAFSYGVSRLGLTLFTSARTDYYLDGNIADRISINRLGEILEAPWFPLGSGQTWVEVHAPGIWNSILVALLGLGLFFVLVLAVNLGRFALVFGKHAWVMALLLLIGASTELYFVTPLFMAFAMYGVAARSRVPMHCVKESKPKTRLTGSAPRQ